MEKNQKHANMRTAIELLCKTLNLELLNFSL